MRLTADGNNHTNYLRIESMEYQDQEKYVKAKEQVETIKGFYIHLAIYLIINIFILVNLYLRTVGNEEVFWKFSNFFTLFFWGIGLLFHAAKTFNLNPFLGKKWEEEQIQKYIKKDEQEANKYK